MTERYRPNVTVACIIEAEKRFLLVEELIDGQQKFNQPAGHLEANESLIDACRREVLEETGLTVTPEALVRIDQFSASKELAFLRFTFCARLVKCQNPKPLDVAIKAAHWLSMDEITALGPKLRSPLVSATLESYLQGQRLPLSLLNSALL